jgi:hypothetical protein
MTFCIIGINKEHKTAFIKHGHEYMVVDNDGKVITLNDEEMNLVKDRGFMQCVGFAPYNVIHYDLEATIDFIEKECR